VPVEKDIVLGQDKDGKPRRTLAAHASRRRMERARGGLPFGESCGSRCVLAHFRLRLPRRGDSTGLGTQSGAEALGLTDECGTLAPGQRADLAIIQLPQRPAKDPHDLLFDDASRVIAVYSGGAPSAADA
jgi:hypothetical protein